MKELSIEEKAKAYDEAIEKSKEFYILCKKCGAKDTVDFLEDSFPELKESEDEKMMHQLYSWMKEFGGAEEYTEKVYTWLKSLIEKQGTSYTKRDVDDAYVEGMAFAKNELEKQGEKKSSDEVLKIRQELYQSGYNDGYKHGCEDTKKQGEQKPIDKIQLGKKYKCIASPRYSTFRRGNIYKPVDNFLCNLMNLCYECFEPIEDSEQKPTDEDMKEALRAEYKKGRADAFVQMQKECSEEDEVKINRIVACLENLNVADNDILLKDVDWLKSIKDRVKSQNTWKPSDGQIRALEYIINNAHNTSYSCKIAKELLEQLKKLKGE